MMKGAQPLVVLTGASKLDIAPDEVDEIDPVPHRLHLVVGDAGHGTNAEV